LGTTHPLPSFENDVAAEHLLEVNAVVVVVGEVVNALIVVVAIDNAIIIEWIDTNFIVSFLNKLVE